MHYSINTHIVPMLSTPQEDTEPVLDVDCSIPVPFLMVCLLAHLLSLVFSTTHTQVFSLRHRSLGSIDTYLAGDFTTYVSQGQLRVVRDLGNFRLGFGHSPSQPGQDKSNLKSKVFLQVLFDNKGIDAIGRSSILRAPEVVSTLPSDFLMRSHWSVINTLPPLPLKF